MFKNWKTKLDAVSKNVSEKNNGIFETSGIFFRLIFSGLIFKMMPFIIKLFKQVITKGWKSLVFISNEKCDGCGICKKICPVDNIDIIDNKPFWKNLCAGCAACFHWCPKEAVQFGITDMNIKQYHNPEAKLADMINQKGKNFIIIKSNN